MIPAATSSIEAFELALPNVEAVASRGSPGRGVLQISLICNIIKDSKFKTEKMLYNNIRANCFKEDVLKWQKLSLREQNRIVTLVPSDTLTMVKQH